MQYRGDHYQLATRLGAMISEERSIGPESQPADNLCAFGKWRERLERGEETFSRNADLRHAVEGMAAPHREFHRTAAEMQVLIRDGFGKNQQAVEALYADHLKAADAVVQAFEQITTEVEKARRLYGDADSFTMGELRQRRADAAGAIGAVIEANRVNMGVNIGAAMADGHTGAAIMEALAAASLALGGVLVAALHITMKRRLVRPMTRVIAALDADARDVLAEAGHVASSSASLSQGSSNQAAALEETSAAIEEITSMARKNLDNAKSANTIMQDNARQVQSSSEAMERMGAAMKEIRESSEKIGDILKTIEAIAFQTNLLALNAAVEAARAGEAGKGFAVVADEVRNLAQRTALSVKDTAELITSTVERVRNGGAITGEIQGRFAALSQTTEKVARMMAEIDGATGEQTIGMEQINRSVSEIDRVNQENAGHAAANAQAGVSLNERSADLMEVMEELAEALESIAGRKAAVAGAASREIPVKVIAKMVIGSKR